MAELTSALLARLHDTLDRDEIRHVLSLYPRAIDRCDAALLRKIYWPEGTDDHGSFSGGLDAFIDWAFPELLKLEQTHHHIGNPCVVVNGSEAHAEAYYIAYHRVKSGTGHDFVVGGRYIDRLQRRGSEWRILARTVTFDYNTTCEGQPWSAFSFTNPGSIGARKPRDALYRTAS
jgi:hypothetical protein